MHPVPWSTRFRKALWPFLRSVLPSDPWQLVYLIGVVCLVVGSRSRWFPRPGEETQNTALRQAFLDPRFMIWWQFLSLPRLILMCVAMAGYFFVFWPRRFVLLKVAMVLCAVPALVLAGIYGSLLVLIGHKSSVLEPTGTTASQILHQMQASV